MSDPLFKPIRMLIAIEGEPIREGFQQAAIATGAKMVSTASHHAEAVELMNRNIYNMFVVDSGLPVQGGIDFARFVRLIMPPMCFAPVILGLSEPSREKIFEARDAGVNSVIALPANAQTFLNTVRGLRQNPCDFIQSDSYNGPDRRKKAASPPDSERRIKPSKSLPGSRLDSKMFAMA